MKQKHPVRDRLKQRIVIETLTQTADGAGGFTSSWATFVTVWAEILAMPNRTMSGESLQAMQLQDSSMIRITIRYVSGITTTMRIRNGTRLFNIRRIINLNESNNFLELIAEEGVAL